MRQLEEQWYWVERARASLAAARFAAEPDIASIHLALFEMQMREADAALVRAGGARADPRGPEPRRALPA